MSTLLLAIETSTTICSVALADGTRIIDSKSVNNGYSHAENLTPFIDELMRKNNLKYNQLKAVAVSQGPGSYTGLRIGVSTAKGICYALNIPLIAIDTLQAMAIDFLNTQYDYLIPAIDARRMEIYCKIYDKNNTQIQETQPLVVEQDTFLPVLEKGKTVFFGNGAEKLQTVIKHHNAFFDLQNGLPDAKNIALLAAQKYQHNQFEDTAYFEPFYLKAFKAGTPKKLL